MATLRSVRLILILATVFLVTGSARADEVPISEAAKLHFAVGVGLLEEPSGAKYAEAYESFHRAYKASPSPKILSNIGLCAMELERDGEAISAYETYLEEVDGILPEERTRIETDLKRLRAGSATFVLNIRPVGALITDERTPDVGPAVINRYQFTDSTVELRVRAGEHKLRVEAEGYESQTFEAEVAVGEKHVERVRLVEIGGKKKKKKRRRDDAEDPQPNDPEPAPKPSPKRGGGISGASIGMLVVTGAFTAGAVVFGVLALSAQADYASYETGGDRLDAENVRATGEALNVTTDVLIAAAAVSAAVSVVLLITTSDGGESASLRVAPTVGGGTVGLDFRF